MAGYDSAAKRYRQSEKRRLKNKSDRSKVKTEIRKYLDTVQSGDKSNAQESFKKIQKLIDTASQKGVYHKNNAARKKSRLHKLLVEMD